MAEKSKFEIEIEAINKASNEIRRVEKQVEDSGKKQNRITKQNANVTTKATRASELAAARRLGVAKSFEKTRGQFAASRIRSEKLQIRNAKLLKRQLDRNRKSLFQAKIAAAAFGVAMVFAFKAGIDIGIKFDAQMETARLGIAGVLKATDRIGEFDNFNDALEVSSTVLQNIKDIAPQTTAKIGELVDGFQQIAGPARNAGLSLKQTTQLTLNLAQAISATGIPTRELAQESRALINGVIDRNARLARTLGITSDQIRQAKAEGELFEFLTSRLDSFAEAGRLAQNTIAGLRSNLDDAAAITFGEALIPSTKVLKSLMRDVIDLLGDESIKINISAIDRAFELLLVTVRGTVEGVRQISEFNAFLGAVSTGQSSASFFKNSDIEQALEIERSVREVISLRTISGLISEEERETLDRQLFIIRNQSENTRERLASVTEIARILNQRTGKTRAEIDAEAAASELEAQERIEKLRQAELDTPEAKRAVDKVGLQLSLVDLEFEEKKLKILLDKGVISANEYSDELIGITLERLRAEQALILQNTGDTVAKQIEIQGAADAAAKQAEQGLFEIEQERIQLIQQESDAREQANEERISFERELKALEDETKFAGQDAEIGDAAEEGLGGQFDLELKRSRDFTDLQQKLEQQRFDDQILKLEELELEKKDAELIREEALQLHKDRITQIEEDGDRSIKEIEERKAEREKAELKAKLSSTAESLGNLSELAEAFGKKGFLAAKAFAIGQAIINGILGVTNAIATGGPAPFNFILAGTVAALSAVNVAKIAAQGYEAGGVIGGGRRLIEVNERGTEGVVNAGGLSNIGARGLDLINQHKISFADLVNPFRGLSPDSLRFTANDEFLGSFASGGVVPLSGNIAPNIAADFATSTPSDVLEGNHRVNVGIVGGRQAMREFQSTDGNKMTVDFLSGYTQNEVFE